MAEKIGKNTQVFPVGHAAYPNGCKRVTVMFDDGSESVTETPLTVPAPADVEVDENGVYLPPGVL